jgi:hypothetical protein
VATPSSPIPADLASGVIIKKGTPVVITRFEFCPKDSVVIKVQVNKKSFLDQRSILNKFLIVMTKCLLISTCIFAISYLRLNFFIFLLAVTIFIE